MLCRKTNYCFASISNLLILVFLFFQSNAQQNPGLSLYAFQQSYSNPASVGLNGESSFQIHYRNQWSQYQSTYDGSGSLGTQIANLSLGIEKLHVGGGLLYMNDLTPSGAGMQFIRGQFAYHYELGDGVLSAGVQVGLSTKSFDGQVYRVREPNDPLASELNGNQIAKSSIDIGLGLMYSTEKWYIGASIDHLNAPSFAFTNTSDATRLQPFIQVLGGVQIDLSEQLSLNPFTQLRVYEGQLLADVGLRLQFAKMFWLGGNIRTNDALSGMFGVSVWKKQIDFGYALDQSISNQTIKAPLSHEFFIRFKLPNLRLGGSNNKATPINTPRFKIN